MNTPEQILEQFKKWLVSEENRAWRRGIGLEEDEDYVGAKNQYERSRAFEDARLKLTELGVEFE